jgi:two-component sensor histidine kinase
MQDTHEAPDMTYVAASGLRDPRPLISKPVRPSRASESETMVQRPDDDDVDLRQLRHHTKNTLQRLIGLLAEVPGLTDTPAGELLARELEYRICLSAQISNALFGLTSAPGSMAERLRSLSGAMVDMMREPHQVLRTGVSVKGCCPQELREAVVRSTHELVGNAVKHGMKGRMHGRIAIRLVTVPGTTTLTVTDNGWGFDNPPLFGEGLTLARLFAERAGGSLEMDGTDGTAAVMTLPHGPIEG